MRHYITVKATFGKSVRHLTKTDRDGQIELYESMQKAYNARTFFTERLAALGYHDIDAKLVRLMTETR